MPDSRKSQFPLTELINSLMPITPMGKAMCAGAAIWFIDWVFVEGQTLFGSRWLKTAVDIGSALAFIPLLHFLFKGARWVTEHLLWRLRRRLIVTYLLIGALPLLLLAFLVGLIAYAVGTQSSVGLVSRKLDGYMEQSRAVTQSLSRDLSRLESKDVTQEEVRRRLQERANALAAIFPEIELSFRQTPGNGFTVTVRGVAADAASTPNAPAASLHDGQPLPSWLAGKGGFDGVIVEDRHPARPLFVSHLVSVTAPAPATLMMQYPVGAVLCGHLSQTANLEVRPGQAVLNGPKLSQPRDPTLGSSIDRGGFPIFKPVADWSSGKQIERDVVLLDPVVIQPGYIWGRVRQFRESGFWGQNVFLFISSLAVFLLIIALAAVVSAIFLTRSITGAVHHLYEGTRRVETGQFDHEIPITGQDQLGELSGSFNRMTRSIRELLRVSADKQRLDQEMKIAAQVQARLFPRVCPKTEVLDFAPGVCIPARAVSGDYYDFFEVGAGRIGIVVADVCGKGVSAALMMANLQANLRGQVQAYHDAYDYKMSLVAEAAAAQASSADALNLTAVPEQHPVQRIVQRVNAQLAAAMIDASYITFFYAEYDERSAALRYTNAGHNPPLLVRKSSGQIERLERGGTVLGLFSDAEYEDVELHLESGDVLAAFTDGLVEARNPRGEEFSEERLTAALRACALLPAAEIERQILETIRRWTADAEQEDDLTLVIFKVW